MLRTIPRGAMLSVRFGCDRDEVHRLATAAWLMSAHTCMWCGAR